MQNRPPRRRYWLIRLTALGLVCTSLGPCTETLVTSTIDGIFNGITRQLVDQSREELGLLPPPTTPGQPTS